MSKAQEVYTEIVCNMSKSERLRLATIILDDLNESSGAILDYGDSWSEDDIRDVTAFSMEHADAIYGDDPIV